MINRQIQYGTYQHYKNQQLYEVIGIALHSETQEEMVIYKALYVCDKSGGNQVWVRSKKIFLDQVEHNGNIVPRFKYIAE